AIAFATYRPATTYHQSEGPRSAPTVALTASGDAHRGRAARSTRRCASAPSVAAANAAVVHPSGQSQLTSCSNSGGAGAEEPPVDIEPGHRFQIELARHRQLLRVLVLRERRVRLRSDDPIDRARAIAEVA